MTADEHAQVAAYVRVLADRMELKDWRFTISLEQPEHRDANAEIILTSGRKFATIRLHVAWSEQSPEEQRQALVHELLHCHVHVVEIVLSHLETNLGDHVYGVVECALEDAIEYATDAIADALAPHLPLPNEGGNAETEHAA